MNVPLLTLRRTVAFGHLASVLYLWKTMHMFLLHHCVVNSAAFRSNHRTASVSRLSVSQLKLSKRLSPTLFHSIGELTVRLVTEHARSQGHKAAALVRSTGDSSSICEIDLVVPRDKSSVPLEPNSEEDSNSVIPCTCERCRAVPADRCAQLLVTCGVLGS